MDEAQVLALITTALAGFKTEFTTEISTAIDTKNQGLAANLTREFKKAQPKQEDEKPEGQANLSMKALQAQIATLEGNIKAEKESSFKSSADAALSTAIANSGTSNPTALKRLLSSDYTGKLKEDAGNWFVTEGDSAVLLKDAVTSYLQTDEGKFFAPPSGTQGSGAKETKTQAATGTKATSTEQAVADAFANV